MVADLSLHREWIRAVMDDDPERAKAMFDELMITKLEHAMEGITCNLPKPHDLNDDEPLGYFHDDDDQEASNF
jgi:hypothetical protein